MIRLATENDILSIMRIIKEIVADMKKEGNPQWHDKYPIEEDFLNDIACNALYVYEKESKVIGFICAEKDTENEYERVSNTTKKEAYIMHRLGVDKNYRKLGIAISFLKYVEELALKNNIFLIKADTEVKNIKMNTLFEKLGYKKLSTFNWSDNDGLFNYYEKNL